MKTQILRAIGFAVAIIVQTLTGGCLQVSPAHAQFLTPTIIMLAPAPNQSYSVSSGNVYQAQVNGLITNVLSGDVSDLQAMGCVLLTPRNNVSATRAPLATDDFTADFGIGSQWVNIAGTPTLYILVAMGSTPGTATWSALAGTGSVNSVALALPSSVFTVSGSPITSTGTLTGTFKTQSANLVFAGPGTGSAAVPSFRALVAADLPAGGSGVSSVALSVPSASIFGVTGSPVTSTGTLGLTTTGILGAIPYFSSTSQLSSTGQYGSGLQLDLVTAETTNGTVASTNRARFGVVWDALNDFGMDNTGATDVSTAFNQVITKINAIPTPTAPEVNNGVKLVFPAGTYSLGALFRPTFSNGSAVIGYAGNTLAVGDRISFYPGTSFSPGFTNGNPVISYPSNNLAAGDVITFSASGPYFIPVFTNGSPIIGFAGNSLAANDTVTFFNAGGALPTGFVSGVNYYVIATGLSSSQFEVSATLGGGAITPSSAGTGTQVGVYNGRLPAGFTAGTSYYVIATGLSSSQFEASASPGGTAITPASAGAGSFGGSLAGGLPSNIFAGIPYYVISTGLSGSQFEVATAPGGSAIVAASAPTGTPLGTHTTPLIPLVPNKGITVEMDGYGKWDSVIIVKNVTGQDDMLDVGSITSSSAAVLYFHNLAVYADSTYGIQRPNSYLFRLKNNYSSVFRDFQFYGPLWGGVTTEAGALSDFMYYEEFNVTGNLSQNSNLLSTQTAFVPVFTSGNSSIAYTGAQLYTDEEIYFSLGTVTSKLPTNVQPITSGGAGIYYVLPGATSSHFQFAIQPGGTAIVPASSSTSTINGTIFFNANVPINTLSWSGGVITAVTRSPHLLNTGDTALVLFSEPKGYNAGAAKITKTDAVTFTYNTPVNPGATYSAFTPVFTNGSPIIGIPNGFSVRVNDPIVFTNSGGALPTNFTSGTTYYVITTGLTSTQFEVAANVGGSGIVAGSAGSGTQTATKQTVALLIKGGPAIGVGAGGKTVGIKAISWSGGVVSVQTLASHSLTTGQLVAISAVYPVGYNSGFAPNPAGASFQITVTGADTFTYPLAVNPGSSTVMGNVVSDCVFAAVPGYGSGYGYINCGQPDTFITNGVTTGFGQGIKDYNGGQGVYVTNVTATGPTSIGWLNMVDMGYNIGIGQLTGASSDTSALVGYMHASTAPVVYISNLTNSSSITTVTTATPHFRQAGDPVAIQGVNPNSWNADAYIATVTGANTFTFVQAPPPAYVSGGHVIFAPSGVANMSCAGCGFRTTQTSAIFGGPGVLLDDPGTANIVFSATQALNNGKEGYDIRFGQNVTLGSGSSATNNNQNNVAAAGVHIANTVRSVIADASFVVGQSYNWSFNFNNPQPYGIIEDPGVGLPQFVDIQSGRNNLLGNARPALGTYLWTPTLTFGGTAASNQTTLGQYFKIGNIVNLSFSISVTGALGSTGAATITGIPILPWSGAVPLCHFAYWTGMTMPTFPPSAVLSGSSILVYISGFAATTALTDSSFTTSSRMDGGCSYVVDNSQ